MVSDLKDAQDKKATTDKDKAEMLNDFFCSMFTNEDISSILTCGKNNVVNEFDDIEETGEMVLKLLKSLDTSKSMGSHGMHPKLLFEMADVLAKPL